MTSFTRLKPLRDRFVEKIRAGVACWEWTGMIDKAGYGRIRGPHGRNGESLYAHRVSYELFIGCIPDGLDLDHLCRNRKCVNPRHLEAVTHKINLLRSSAPSIEIHLSDSCGRGHRKTAANIYWRRDRPGKWECRACHKERENREGKIGDMLGILK